MKNIARVAVTTALALVGATAAQAQFYVEGTYASTTMKIDDGIKFKPAALIGVLGYSLNPNLAVEGTLGIGAKSGSTTVQDVETGENFSARAKYKNSLGIYIKPRVQVTTELELFARLGYTKSKVELSNGNVSESFSEGSTSWGFGGNYAIDKNLYLTASYMNFYKKDGVKIDGFNLGVGYKF